MKRSKVMNRTHRMKRGRCLLSQKVLFVSGENQRMEEAHFRVGRRKRSSEKKRTKKERDRHDRPEREDPNAAENQTGKRVKAIPSTILIKKKIWATAEDYIMVDLITGEGDSLSSHNKKRGKRLGASRKVCPQIERMDYVRTSPGGENPR